MSAGSKIALSILLFPMLCSLFSCSTTLSGTVTDEFNKPVFIDGKINVVQVSRQGTSGLSVVLDIGPDGKYELDQDLEEGEYLVEPLIPGYQYGSSTVMLDSSKEVNFKVKKITAGDERFLRSNGAVKLGHGSGQVNLTPPSF